MATYGMSKDQWLPGQMSESVVLWDSMRRAAKLAPWTVEDPTFLHGQLTHNL
jgi:hypothetical protein